MMRTPAFWHRPDAGLRARLLSPLGRLYGAATARAMAEPGLDVGVPVITVGNFVAGGAGKTPTAIAIAELLTMAGEHPAFLSRGYGGLPPLDAIAVDGQSARVVGDEPILLSRIAPTFVGRKRVRAAHLAVKTVRPSVLICDDGLQSRAIEPTFALAVVDGETGVGNNLCVPAGPLRAPLADQIAFIDALVLIGAGVRGEAVAAQVEAEGKPCFYADLEPAGGARRLAGARVLAFAGIGMPQKFFRMLEDIGARVIGTRSFPDHHAYRPREIARLQAHARAEGAMLVTTEKDIVRLPPLCEGGLRVHALGVRLTFRDEASVGRYLQHRLRSRAED